MLKKILIGLAALVAILLVVITMQPATTHVERSRDIKAPVAAVFPLVNDYKARTAWYPWDKLDPNQKRTYSDPSAGVGASSAWEGNDQVGKGRQAMKASKVNERIDEDLEFIAPFPSTSRVSFTFAAAGEGTKVTWAMDSDNSFMGKAFSLVMDMDAMIGKDFEQGLVDLESNAIKLAQTQAEEQKKKAEAEAAAAAAAAQAEAEALKAKEAAAAAE